MSNCIIIGGSGFIGTHLIQYFLDHNIHTNIFVLDIVEPQVKHPTVTYHYCDVRQPIDIELNYCEVLYNLAALCREPGYEYYEYFDTNYGGAGNVCAFAERQGIKKIIFTSTMMVFSPSEETMSEESPTYPDTAYGISKLLAEKVHEIWQNSEPERSLKIVRPSVVFGKGENANYTRLYRLLKRGIFFYIGRKDTVKSSVYITDVVRFLYWCEIDEHRQTIFNFTIPERLTIQHICNTICEVMEFKKPFLVVPFRLAWLVSLAFELLNSAGLIKTSVHHRRIEKLSRSTNIACENCLSRGFEFSFDLQSAIEDWKKQCGERGLF